MSQLESRAACYKGGCEGLKDSLPKMLTCTSSHYVPISPCLTLNSSLTYPNKRLWFSGMPNLDFRCPKKNHFPRITLSTCRWPSGRNYTQGTQCNIPRFGKRIPIEGERLEGISGIGSSYPQGLRWTLPNESCRRRLQSGQDDGGEQGFQQADPACQVLRGAPDGRHSMRGA